VTVKLQGKKIMGINGAGRIGKLTLWNHIGAGYFNAFVVNTGRKAGKKIEDLIDYLVKDSTYGSIDRFLYGYTGRRVEVEIIDREKEVFTINGLPIKLLTSARNPRDINWAREGVRLVVECTGVYIDPTVAADAPKGSARGHLEAGAEKVVISAPFKISDSAGRMPEDSAMFVYGVNHDRYDPQTHHIVSAASCTTTGLAHMVKPLLETKETAHIVTASMSTVHAATNNQNILDAVPKEGASDLRKNRSVFNNIILTTTGAARALEEILPEIKTIGFMADSVRIPTSTTSLIMLNVTFKTKLDAMGEPMLNRDLINEIYRKAAAGAQRSMVIFSERQNVSADIIGYPAAIVIEGVETHTRTGFIAVDTATMRECGVQTACDISIPVTHAKIFGWYDNELGSYVSSLGKLTVYLDKNMP
jgi:glyceraldehyde 3-phosphate dehydrogenase